MWRKQSAWAKNSKKKKKNRKTVQSNCEKRKNFPNGKFFMFRGKRLKLK